MAGEVYYKTEEDGRMKKVMKFLKVVKESAEEYEQDIDDIESESFFDKFC